MKRTDITDIFPEATGEQINRLMNLNGEDINRARRGLEDVQTQLEESQRLLEAANNAAKDLQSEKERADGLQEQINQMTAAENLRLMREKVSGETGVPAKLLTGETEDACREQATAISEYARPKYPVIHDAGEQHIDTKQTTREQFAEWFNTEMKG